MKTKKTRRPTEDRALSSVTNKHKIVPPPRGYTGFSDGTDEVYERPKSSMPKIVYSTESSIEVIKKKPEFRAFRSHQSREKTPEDSEVLEIDFSDFSETDWEDFFDNELRVS